MAGGCGWLSEVSTSLALDGTVVLDDDNPRRCSMDAVDLADLDHRLVSPGSSNKNASLQLTAPLTGGP